ncbi:MAG: hypothetical protein HZB99_00465 [Candidatus Harrisonbacteria bacterium]|nr:hypothetical protein [Candidatus Harrisonbacteria bacterium]
MNKLILIIIAVAVVVGGGAFYGGMKYVESKSLRGQFSRVDFQNLSSEERQQRFQEIGGSGGSRGGRLGQSGGFASGEIISKDDKSITVKLRDGGSKIVFYSDVTEVGKFINGVLSDLKIGENVSINGTVNSDGSITAQSVQIRPLPPILN